MDISGPQAGSGNARDFKYVMDPKTGLSSFYDASKFTLAVIPEDQLSFAEDAKAKAYSITPKDGGSPILHIEVHAPSGSSEDDKAKRKAVLEGVKNKVAAFLNAHPEYEDVVYSIDANVSSRVAIKKGQADKLEDFKLNEEGIRDEVFGALIPEDLTVEACATGTAIIKKTRAGDMGDNQQLNKALVTDPGVKSYCIHTKRIKADVVNKVKAREESVVKALAAIVVPVKVVTFGIDETHGSDHSETPRLEVRGIGFVTFPLINTFGARGFSDPKDYYKDPKPEHAAIRVAATQKMLDIIIAELKAKGITEATVDKKKVSIDAIGSDKSVAERANFIMNVESAIVEDEAVLKRIVDTWSQSPEFQKWDELFLDDKRKFTTEANKLECVSRIHNKNYKVADKTGKTLEDPKKEGINIIIDKDKGTVTYRLTTLKEDVIVEGTVNFKPKADKLEAAETAELRNLIINDAKKVLAAEPRNAKPVFASFERVDKEKDSIILGKDKLEAGKFYLGKPNKDNVMVYGIMLGPVKYTGKITVKTEGVPDQEAFDLITTAIATDLAAKELTIVNGKDIGNQIAEHMDAQPCSGFPANFAGVHPRHLQLQRLAEIGQGVDFVTVTENSDLSHLDEKKPSEKSDALLAKELKYGEVFARQMNEVCAAMTQKRKPVLEDMPKKVKKAKAASAEPAKADPFKPVNFSGEPKPGEVEKIRTAFDSRRQMTPQEMQDTFPPRDNANAADTEKARQRLVDARAASKSNVTAGEPLASASAKSTFPKWAVAGFTIAGALIGAGVAIAVLGFVWPVAVAAVAAAIVVGGARAIYAKVTGRVEKPARERGIPVEDTLPLPGSSQTAPSQKAADDVMVKLDSAPTAVASTPVVTLETGETAKEGRRPSS